MVESPPANAEDMGSIPGLGRSPGVRSGTPLQYTCLENPMDTEALWATVHGVTKRQIQLETKQQHSTVCVYIYVTSSLSINLSMDT